VANRILVAPRAEAQIHAIDAWWRTHRRAAPSLFLQELSEAFSMLVAAPKAGHPYAHPEVKGVRRIHLRSTRHHVYYLAGEDVVVVLAVWGSVKAGGPDLSEVT